MQGAIIARNEIFRMYILDICTSHSGQLIPTSLFFFFRVFDANFKISTNENPRLLDWLNLIK